MSEKRFSTNSELRGGKFKIKINGAPGSGSLVRIGDFCEKQFNSGEALRGHRRYHIQAHRKMEAQNQAQQQKKVNYTLRIKSKDLVIRDYDNNNDNDNNIIESKIGNLNCSTLRSSRCLVCDNDFPSKKSLYGHMRLHPDRDWRGMNPTFTTTDNALASSSELMKVQDHQNHNKRSSSSTSEESLSVRVNLSLSCSGRSCLKKDIRRRKSIGEAEAAHIAAKTLMDMHLYGNSHLGRCHLPPRDEPTPEEAALLPVKERNKNVMMNHGGGSSSSPAGKQSWDNCKEKLEGSDGNEELEAENKMWDMKVSNLIKGKKKLNMKKRKLGTEIIKSEGELLMIRSLKKQEVKPSQSYVCDICNKSFPCFQALGGHKTKHRKNIFKSTKGKEVVEQRQEEEEEGRRKVCINGTLLSNAGLRGEEEEAGEASQQFASKIRSFDLNVPYVLESMKQLRYK